MKIDTTPSQDRSMSWTSSQIRLSIPGRYDIFALLTHENRSGTEEVNIILPSPIYPHQILESIALLRAAQDIMAIPEWWLDYSGGEIDARV